MVVMVTVLTSMLMIITSILNDAKVNLGKCQVGIGFETGRPFYKYLIIIMKSELLGARAFDNYNMQVTGSLYGAISPLNIPVVIDGRPFMQGTRHSNRMVCLAGPQRNAVCRTCQHFCLLTC